MADFDKDPKEVEEEVSFTQTSVDASKLIIHYLQDSDDEVPDLEDAPVGGPDDDVSGFNDESLFCLLGISLT